VAYGAWVTNRHRYCALFVVSRHLGRISRATLVSLALVIVAAGPAAADPQNDKARVDRQLAQARSMYEAASTQAQSALAAYTAATAQLPAVQDRLAVARGLVAARTAQARQADREAAAARSVADAANQRYDALQAQVDAAQTEVGDFVAAAYKGSGLLTMDSLLESRTPNDLVDRLNYLDKSAESQHATLEGYLAARLTARDAANQAQAAQRTVDAAARTARDALASAQAAQAAAEQDQAQVTALISQQHQAMATANAARDATLAEYRALQQESDRIAAQLRAMSGGRASGLHAGHFITPVHGAWKSSDFGMRYDPYYRVWQLHAGVDLAAPGGTPIYAAADGRVVQAGWAGGYGNYTCIYHGMYQGRGLSTCYGHQSAMLVRDGQTVHQGDVIGRVGTTGASTGDHLHFEVRVNGTPVQPLDWLDSCLC
jgi:murein DD-endopeptidase MepM/ murein hydrolase activator NlpD